MKCQRTGLTEGTLIFNNYLKQFGLYRSDTEDEFINWLYSTAGWYDKDIKGSYFDIDTKAVKRSNTYRFFLEEFENALRDSTYLHLMLHSSYHLHGLHLATQYARQFSPTNYSYWTNKQLLKDLIGKQKILIVSSIAPLIAEKYPDLSITPYQTKHSFFNSGEHKNSWETLDAVTEDIKKLTPQFDLALVSYGPYGCLLVDRICKMQRSALTIGSGIYSLFPVGKIPKEYRPEGWSKVEGGRYWRYH